MYEEYLELLEELGFTKGESTVYLALLESGPQIASELSEKSKIHRINLYDLLKKLVEKGLVTHYIKGKTKTYKALPPQTLLKIEKQRIQNLEQAIPSLEKLQKTRKDELSAELFIGKAGVKNAIDLVAISKTEVLLFASGWGFEERYPIYSKQWYNKIKKNKITIKGVINENLLKENRPLPIKFTAIKAPITFPSTTALFENKTLIINWNSTEPIAILIQSKNIFDSYKQYFEILWNKQS